MLSKVTFVGFWGVIAPIDLPWIRSWISRYCSKIISSHPHHCIIHREALASKEFSSVLNEVMQVVIKVANFVKSRDFNCRLFKDICSTENAEHSTLLLYEVVRWLSRCSRLKRVFILRDKVKDFLHNRKNEMQLFSDELFIARLVLLTDVFEKLNELNISLQGRGKWVFELQTSVRAFVNKLTIFVIRTKTGDFVFFTHYKEFLATTDSEVTEVSFSSVKQYLVQYLTKLQANFE